MSRAKGNGVGRASAPAARASGGFSFVELLITIVLVGIVFAAMVPLFVNAQKAAAGDKARNTALNLAQDRVEKIRQLTFAQACDEDAIIAEFGTTWTSYHHSAGKIFSIGYSSEPGPGSTPAYTKVEVTVWWTAPPSPVRPVTVSTIVANNEIATVTSPTPAGSTSPSPSPTTAAAASPSPSPSSSATAYPNQNFTLTCATNEWYGHKVRLYQTNVTPVVDKGTKEFNGNTPAVWSNIPSGAYRVEHTYGWWDVVTEVSTVYLTSNLTIRYDNYNSLYPGH